MGSPKSVTTENPQLHRQSGTVSRGTPRAAPDVADAAPSDEEHLSRVRWHSEVAPSGVLTGVLGEMAFYYETCCLHHQSAQQRRGKPR
jgi:hypothetical protein